MYNLRISQSHEYIEIHNINSSAKKKIRVQKYLLQKVPVETLKEFNI